MTEALEIIAEDWPPAIVTEDCGQAAVVSTRILEAVVRSTPTVLPALNDTAIVDAAASATVCEDRDEACTIRPETEETGARAPLVTASAMTISSRRTSVVPTLWLCAATRLSIVVDSSRPIQVEAITKPF
jgi:hypothetical protein